MAVHADGKILLAGVTDSGPNSDFALARYLPDGTLDASFDGDGLLTTDFGGFNDQGRSAAVQTDGKILLGGKSEGFALRGCRQGGRVCRALNPRRSVWE